MTNPYLSRYLLDDLPIAQSVQELVDKFKNLWWQCDTSLPDLGRTFSPQEQKTDEANFQNYLKILEVDLKKISVNNREPPAPHQRILDRSIDLAKTTFGFNDHHISALRSYGFVELAADFAHKARRFDPLISDQDIYQAMRNVWSMNFMQLVLGIPMEMTPSIFAYSLIYPYSDNYLDDPSVSIHQKNAFNRSFARRLAGEDFHPANEQENILSDLIGMIEAQFKRSHFPEVYSSLLAIHQAQTRSVELQREDCSPYELDVLGICFEKGGTSVLADGYLVNGTLSPSQREFMFYYGTLTQLVDDLEDVEQDLRRGVLTVFSHTARHWSLEAVTNRTFHFSQKVLEAMDQIAAPGAQALKELIHLSITPLLILEVGSLGRFYSRNYLNEMERHSPFRFSFLRKQRRKFTSQAISLVPLIDALAASAAAKAKGESLRLENRSSG